MVTSYANGGHKKEIVIQPNIADVPQGALQSVQTPSGKTMQETPKRATESGSLFQDGQACITYHA